MTDEDDIRSQIAKLEQLIERLPEDAVIDRRSMEQRIDRLLEMLEESGVGSTRGRPESDDGGTSGRR